MRSIIVIVLFLLLTSSIDTPTKVLFIGDSITAYRGGWQDEYCQATNKSCTNLAKNGMRTKWMLNTLKDHLKDNSDYNVIIIYGGINDIFTHIKVDSAIRNVQRMVDLANEYNIKPVVIIGYNSNNLMQNTWIKDKVVEEQIRQRYVSYQNRLGKEITGAQIIPIVPTIKSDGIDGIHLSSAGHKKFKDWIISHQP